MSILAVLVLAGLFTWTICFSHGCSDENAPAVPAAVTEAIKSAEAQASLPEGHLKVSAYQLREDMEKLEYLDVTFVCEVAVVEIWNDPDMGMPQQSVWVVLADSKSADDSVFLNWDPVNGEPKKGEIWVIGGSAFAAGEPGENIPGVSVSHANKVGQDFSVLQVDKTKFSDAWRALTKIEAASWDGLGAGELLGLWQELRDAVDRLPGELGSDETMCAAALGEITQAYGDSFSLTMRSADQLLNEGIHSDSITVREVGREVPLVDRLEEMIATYGLTLSKETIPMSPEVTSSPELTFWVVPESSITAIWAWASVRADALRPILEP